MGWRADPVTKQQQPILQSIYPVVSKARLCGEHPFLAGIRGDGARAGKIPVLGPAQPLPSGNGSMPPEGCEVPPLRDDSEVIQATAP